MFNKAHRLQTQAGRTLEEVQQSVHAELVQTSVLHAKRQHYEQGSKRYSVPLWPCLAAS